MTDSENEILYSKIVYAVIGNKDLTEGRGLTYVKKYCETEATARRIGKKGYVMGSDCPVERRIIFKKGDTWLGPVDIEPPNEEDLMNQKIIDERNSLIDRAKSLGFTDNEIKKLRS